MNAANTIGSTADHGSTVKAGMRPGAPSPAKEIADLIPAGRRYGYGTASILPYLVQSLRSKVVPTIACVAAAPTSRRGSRARPGK
jgi:hypothetical protein